jgi:hypothetical protein
MPVNLAEYGKQLGEDNSAKPFVETFAEKSDLLAAMPIKGAKEGKHVHFRTAVLPTTAFRAINTNGNESSGAVTKFEDAVAFIDEYIDVDRAMVENFGPPQRAASNSTASTVVSTC